MRNLLLTVGFLALAIGLLWIGQGTGWVPWPANTIMDYNMAFTWYGLALIALSGAMIWYSRR